MINVKYSRGELSSINSTGGNRDDRSVVGSRNSGNDNNSCGHKRKSRSGSGDREDALKKYQEKDDNNYGEDFSLEDSEELNLSYSKFSHVSGISFLSNRGTRLLGSAGDSPFVKKIQSKLQDIKNDEKLLGTGDGCGDGEQIKNSRRSSNDESPSKFHRIKDAESELVSNENESPFLEQVQVPAEKEPGILKSKLQQQQQQQPQHKRLEDTKAPEPFFRLNQHNFVVPKRNIGPSLLSNLSDATLNSTPGRIQERKSSVKISLTPAQRLERKDGSRSANGLANFQFTSLVGRGAFASVYKGINLKTNQTLAIKQMILEPGQNVMELMGEIDLLKVLKHPNIVKYHGFVKTSTSLNVFLEYCSGGSLRQLYKRNNRGLEEAQIVHFVQQILNGLNYLHEQGVVHRDVKAANVLMTEDDSVKLADFGVATKVTSQHETVVGTPNWMAPETVLGGEGLCTASDIWSLGATIIELFTMHPPYHDLNPMATLHAIGTDEHPPLPNNISSLAKDFLLACFQKQPSLRVSAKLLLKHKWITHKEEQKRVTLARSELRLGEEQIAQKSINSYSEQMEENWDGDFGELDFSGVKLVSQGLVQGSILHSTKPTLTKDQLLEKYFDNDDIDLDIDPTMNFKDSQDLESRMINKFNQGFQVANTEAEEEDPFINIDADGFDTNELEIQSKTLFLLTKLTTRVEICQSGNENVIKSLTKITGRLLHLVKKYPTLHDTIIRDHGIQTLAELLENAQELSMHQKLWFHTLSILNGIFDQNVSQFENFCLLGGIPIVTQFRNTSYSLELRCQVVKFVEYFNKSDKALTMFISCGGLRVLSKFIEEDFDSTPTFPLVSIECIHNILFKDLVRSKSNLCRILSKYGVIFWFVVLLNRLTKVDVKPIDQPVSKLLINEAIDKIIDIIKCFGQSELKVRQNVASSDLFKLLIKVYPCLQLQHQLVILKFFKSCSQVSSILKPLHSSDIFEFLVDLMKRYTPSKAHYKEVINIVCPTLYNCCYLNHSRERTIVELGCVPLLKNLAKINLPFRQFVLPILCELVHCDVYVRDVLKKNDILSVYFDLLLDPYWQSNALDSLVSWFQTDSEYVCLGSPQASTFLVSGFMLSKVSNLESSLDNYLKLVTIHKAIRRSMLKDSLIENILVKLNVHINNSVIQLTLLRILRCLVLEASRSNVFTDSNIQTKLSLTLPPLKSRKLSVLVDRLASDIEALIVDVYV